MWIRLIAVAGNHITAVMSRLAMSCVSGGLEINTPSQIEAGDMRLETWQQITSNLILFFSTHICRGRLFITCVLVLVFLCQIQIASLWRKKGRFSVLYVTPFNWKKNIDLLTHLHSYMYPRCLPLSLSRCQTHTSFTKKRLLKMTGLIRVYLCFHLSYTQQGNIFTLAFFHEHLQTLYKTQFES